MLHEAHIGELVTAYCRGDATAFDRLYAHYRLPLFNYIRRQTGSDDLAEDIYQEVWFRVIRRLGSYQDRGNFSAWLYTIARNCLADHWRRQAPLTATQTFSEETECMTPERRHWLEDCLQRFSRLLSGLAADQRDAYLLQQESGLSLQLIAEVCGCGLETVKSRLRYANRKLREGLEGCDEQTG